MIKYKCSHCGASMESPVGLAGSTDTCPACGLVTSVPKPKRSSIRMILDSCSPLLRNAARRPRWWFDLAWRVILIALIVFCGMRISRVERNVLEIQANVMGEGPRRVRGARGGYISDMQSKLRRISSDIDDISTGISNIQNEVEDIDDISTDISDIQDKLDDIERKVKALYNHQILDL